MKASPSKTPIISTTYSIILSPIIKVLSIFSSGYIFSDISTHISPSDIISLNPLTKLRLSLTILPLSYSWSILCNYTRTLSKVILSLLPASSLLTRYVDSLFVRSFRYGLCTKPRDKNRAGFPALPSLLRFRSRDSSRYFLYKFRARGLFCELFPEFNEDTYH